MTPLHFLCATGVADCVRLLVEKRADMSQEDYNGRGCLQLAKNSQGKKQTLATWLKQHAPAIPETSGKGRAKGEMTRGQVSNFLRTRAGPRHNKSSNSTERNKGYKPQHGKRRGPKHASSLSKGEAGCERHQHNGASSSSKGKAASSSSRGKECRRYRR